MALETPPLFDPEESSESLDFKRTWILKPLRDAWFLSRRDGASGCFMLRPYIHSDRQQWALTYYRTTRQEMVNRILTGEPIHEGIHFLSKHPYLYQDILECLERVSTRTEANDQ